jgi:hypothetical protein
MIAQRVRGAESRIEPRLSNGPLRVQSKAGNCRVFCNVRHTSVARDMMVSYRVYEEVYLSS